jgi:hypothetical protein
MDLRSTQEILLHGTTIRPQPQSAPHLDTCEYFHYQDEGLQDAVDDSSLVLAAAAFRVREGARKE